MPHQCYIKIYNLLLFHNETGYFVFVLFLSSDVSRGISCIYSITKNLLSMRNDKMPVHYKYIILKTTLQLCFRQ